MSTSKFICSACGYSAKNKRGLSIHFNGQRNHERGRFFRLAFDSNFEFSEYFRKAVYGNKFPHFIRIVTRYDFDHESFLMGIVDLMNSHGLY